MFQRLIITSKTPIEKIRNYVVMLAKENHPDTEVTITKPSKKYDWWKSEAVVREKYIWNNWDTTERKVLVDLAEHLEFALAGKYLRTTSKRSP